MASGDVAIARLKTRIREFLQVDIPQEIALEAVDALAMFYDWDSVRKRHDLPDTPLQRALYVSEIMSRLVVGRMAQGIQDARDLQNNVMGELDS
jgi:hypothetical protein